MGGKNTKGKTKEELLSEYEEFKKEYDPRFEEVTIYRSKANPEEELMITKDIVFQKKEDFDRFRKRLVKRKGLLNPNILRLEHVLGKHTKTVLFNDLLLF